MRTTEMNTLVEALRERYPSLTQQAAESAAQAIVNGVANRLAAGARLGTVVMLPDGDIDLSIIYLAEEAGETGGGRT